LGEALSKGGEIVEALAEIVGTLPKNDEVDIALEVLERDF